MKSIDEKIWTSPEFYIWVYVQNLVSVDVWTYTGGFIRNPVWDSIGLIKKMIKDDLNEK